MTIGSNPSRPSINTSAAAPALFLQRAPVIPFRPADTCVDGLKPVRAGLASIAAIIGVDSTPMPAAGRSSAIRHERPGREPFPDCLWPPGETCDLVSESAGWFVGDTSFANTPSATNSWTKLCPAPDFQDGVQVEARLDRKLLEASERTDHRVRQIYEQNRAQQE